MSSDESRTIDELEDQLAASQETIAALKRAAENRAAQPGSHQIAVQKAMANLQNTIRLRSQALAESEAMYRALFDHSPLMAFKIGPDLRVRDLNRTSRRSRNLGEGDPLGQPLARIFAEQAQRKVRRVLENGEGEEHEVPLRDGRWVDLTAARIPGRDDIQVLLRDVTKQRDLEEKLRQSQKMEAIGQLAGGIAHDFNNLLCGIMGYTELLAEELDPDLRTTYVQEILSTSERAAQLISRLLAFSRRGRLESKPLDIHEIIQTVVGIVNRTIDRRIRIETDFQAESSTVLGDISQLESAILNLSLNARDAMPQGGTLLFETRTVWLDEDAMEERGFELLPGAYLLLSVTDTGTGIAREYLDRIFDPFFTTKPTGHGTGLGLAAVYGTVRSHEGQILVDSEPGKGSRFQVCLPLAAQSTTPREEEPAQRKSGTGRILLVDDESVVRQATTRMLEKMGYEVVSVESGKKAIDALSSDPSGFDLVLLDFVMPEMHGSDVLPLLKNIQSTLPVVFTSGFSFLPEDSLEEFGGDGFLQKPFTSRTLAEVIQATLHTPE